MAPDTLNLTISQAVRAVCLDFRSYEPQTMLFCEVLRALHGPAVAYTRDARREGLWISEGPHHTMRWRAGDDLIEYLCKQLMRQAPDPQQLAAICRRVFQTSCRPFQDADTGEWMIGVETDMAAFSCRQCGQCCTRLDYRDGVTARDVTRLEAAGRTDILEWIRSVRTTDGETVYRIWVAPGTNRFAHPCPFLVRGPAGGTWRCRIHDVKPQICRNYPVSRKHARMTGCPGFDKR